MKEVFGFTEDYWKSFLDWVDEENGMTVGINDGVVNYLKSLSPKFISNSTQEVLKRNSHLDANYVGEVSNPCFYYYSTEDNEVFCYNDKCKWVVCDFSDREGSVKNNTFRMIPISFNQEK